MASRSISRQSPADNPAVLTGEAAASKPINTDRRLPALPLPSAVPVTAQFCFGTEKLPLTRLDPVPRPPPFTLTNPVARSMTMR